ncbi:MAG TPA: GNAT family N-acetyltransferase [Ferruginibacter sp.]|nr:GNAT family N-acetyltransferase [Ferruginibacter sp.]
MTIFTRTDSGNSDFKHLVALLDADLAKRDGDQHSFYAQYNGINDIRHVIVCYAGEKPVGCGAFKEYDHTKAEIKRMYILPEYRNQSLGQNILRELELWAAEENFSECILETGRNNPAAIKLYEKAGYTYINNYGQYKDVENSVCMKKEIL